ncbi:MAG TPA: hypothetical protein VNO75_11060 [Gemmatimonadaceae bacterium]|nr:hypothetical protein [Gemmatimonadaceae bacterium]
MHRGFVGVAMVCASVGTADAQRCRVAAETNEAKLLAFYTAPIAFSMATAPQVTQAGFVRFGAELEYVPKPDPALEQTGACFTQKSEETSLSPVFGRPRITIGAPLGFTIELAYLPPVTIARATPNLFSFAIAHASHFSIGPRGGTTLMLRGHGTYGTVKGAITCPEASLQQTSPTAPCHGTEPSDDTFRPNMFGGEIAVGVTPTIRAFSLYVGAGANSIDPHFRVGFTDLAGFVDTTRVELQEPMVRATVFGGITAFVRQAFDIGAQVYSVPSDATMFRLMGGFRFR